MNGYNRFVITFTSMKTFRRIVFVGLLASLLLAACREVESTLENDAASIIEQLPETRPSPDSAQNPPAGTVPLADTQDLALPPGPDRETPTVMTDSQLAETTPHTTTPSPAPTSQTNSLEAALIEISSDSVLAYLETLTTIQPYSGWRSSATAGEAQALDFISDTVSEFEFLHSLGLEVERQSFSVYLSTEIRTSQVQFAATATTAIKPCFLTQMACSMIPRRTPSRSKRNPFSSRPLKNSPHMSKVN